VTVRTASIDTYLRPRGGLRTESLRAPAVAERIARGHYRRPSHLSLHAVTDTMSAIFHVSPDAGWPTLHDFIGRIDRQLVATMYEFDAEYVRDALLERLSTDRRTLWFVSHHRGESMLRFVETMKARLKGRMHHVWASAGGNDLIFPRAYHIKVAVRDRRELWLSSGNWKQSGQPLLDGSDQRWATFVAGHNREWHAVIDNGALATQLDDYIRYDFDEAQRVPRPEAVAWPDVSVLVPTVEAKAPEVRRFPPYPVARRLTIEPLLTPDNYHRAVAQLLRGARKRIYFQNQALSLLEDENEPAFVELLSLLKARQRDLDVKIIVRDLATYGRPAMETQRQLLERLRDFGFEMQRIKLQRACHTKGIVVDSRIVLLGSHNWTNLGTLYNRDASLVVHDADVARYFEEIFLHDWTTLAHQQIEEPPHVRAPAPGEPVAEGMTSVSLRDILDEHVL
jgi:phosphatidylserine/phosphatidylglycerophosphate/cardiolipin synthase-like enzyme